MSNAGAVSSLFVQTDRLKVHLLASGPEHGTPVLFIHGNCSSARFFKDTLAALPPGFRGLAVDLRGYGETEPKPIDATRGLRDFSDDCASVLRALGLGDRPVHLVGWSMGAGVALQLALDLPGKVRTLVLESPVSPFGFGGTKDAQGTPCWPDFAGSGGGTGNPEFIKRLAEGDRSADSPFSPRNVMNSFYFKPPFRAAADEEDFVTVMLQMRHGDGFSPGDLTPSTNWPGVAPGTRGINNAFSPKYLNLSAFGELRGGPEVLWIRGADDQIVSDTSLFDLGYLGQLGAVPGWPGRDVYPPQPMVSQMRALLDRYQANGGRYREAILSDCGHSPHVERPSEFRSRVFSFLADHP
jgi:pimeloyl-ACP methyl ester carboxylesterase